MEVSVFEPTVHGIKSLLIKHQGDEFEVPTTGYSSIKITDVDDLFTVMNAMIAKLPMQQQQRLYETYKRANEIILDVYNLHESQTELVACINEIYEIITEDMARDFVEYSGLVVLPPDLKTDYAERDEWSPDYTKRTYLKPEYIELVVFTLGLRFMVPIWGNYLSLTSTHSGNEFKEDTASFIISSSKLVEWVGYERVVEYIKHTANDSGGSLALTIAGLSSLEIPDYLVSLTVVRRLATAPVSFKVDKDHIVKTIYNFVRQNVDRLDSRMAGKFRNKKPRSDMFEDDNLCYIDMHRVSQDVPDGIKLINEAYTEKPRVIVDAIDQTVPDELLERSLARAEKLVADDITKFHITLTGWVLMNKISPKSIDSLSIPAQRRCIGVAQAILFHWDFGQLGMLMTSTPIDLNENPEWVTRDARGRLKAENRATLDKLYPHFKRSSKRSEYDKDNNIAVEAINIMVSILNMFGWRTPERSSPEMRKARSNSLNNSLVATNNQVMISSDIRDVIAELIIRINQQPF